MNKETEAFEGNIKAGCQCPACQIIPHKSDCAVHRMPALPIGECNCGAAKLEQLREKMQGKLKQYCKESGCGQAVANCGKDTDCKPRACWHYESGEILQLFKEASADLVEDALCEFAPSIYSRSICRADIANWLKKRGG